MDKIGLSLKPRRLASWLDARCRPDSLIRKQFHGAPFGGCYVTIDPGHQAPYASANLNRVYLCGAEPGIDADSLRHLTDLFSAEGVKRFFVWLSPGPDMDVARGWLEQSGLSLSGAPAIRASIETVLRRRRSKPISRSGRWGADEIAAAGEQLGEALWPE